MHRVAAALLVVSACKSDLDGHWVGEACGEGSGYRMDFTTELATGGKGRDRIWAGRGTLVQSCLGSEAYGSPVRDSTVACEWQYDIAMRHHTRDSFVGRIFFGFDNCTIPDDPEFTEPTECPFYLWYTISDRDELRSNLAMGVEALDSFAYRDCDIILERID